MSEWSRRMREDPESLRLYGDLAEWWPLLSAPEDYAAEARIFAAALREALAPGPPAERPTLLELGSGGGNNASHLKADFDAVLVDRSPAMLEVSRRLNPECPHHQGDMRGVRLGRTFDAVFVHDAVMYLTTAEDLVLAAGTAFVHTRPGGAALFVPDCFRETFRPLTTHGGHDAGGRGLRYLSWTGGVDPAGRSFPVDMVYLLREGDGPPRCVHERHRMGLFSRDAWRETLEAAGFTVRFLPFEPPGAAQSPGEMILARRPDAGP